MTYEEIVRRAKYHTWWTPLRHDEYSDKSEKLPKQKHPASKAVTKFVPSRRGGCGEKWDS